MSMMLANIYEYIQFVIDFFGFFKLFAKQVKDFFEVETFTDLQGRHMMNHMPMWWISLQDGLLRQGDDGAVQQLV